jgi:hypothetical protein
MNALSLQAQLAMRKNTIIFTPSLFFAQAEFPKTNNRNRTLVSS